MLAILPHFLKVNSSLLGYSVVDAAEAFWNENIWGTVSGLDLLHSLVW